MPCRAGLVPEALPPVTDLAVGRDGSVWLRRGRSGRSCCFPVNKASQPQRTTSSSPSGRTCSVARCSSAMIGQSASRCDSERGFSRGADV